MASEVWPMDALEVVASCPYCGAMERTLAFGEVEDWAFGCALGLWQYWDCAQCHALYLQPRPTPASIGNAYSHYYTHAKTAGKPRLLSALKQRVRNELWSQTWKVTIAPRLGLPYWLGWVVTWLKPFIAEPFGLRQWAQSPKGMLIDVGCGNGDKLSLAARLGWRTLGIEMDASAVQAAKAQGLNVEHGGYELLDRYQGQADCVVCSHVLEHVHQPLELLRLLLASLKPRGVLLLSAPNASSHLRRHYGKYWRGLEAPRHLAIPDANWLMAWLHAQGFQCTQVPSYDLETALESERMRRKGNSLVSADLRAARALLNQLGQPAMAQQDIVQLVCERAWS